MEASLYCLLSIKSKITMSIKSIQYELQALNVEVFIINNQDSIATVAAYAEFDDFRFQACLQWWNHYVWFFRTRFYFILFNVGFLMLRESKSTIYVLDEYYSKKASALWLFHPLCLNYFFDHQNQVIVLNNMFNLELSQMFN